MELSDETLLEMFWYMLLSRRLDERAWIMHRQGKIAFHISAIGHEAAQVGAGFAIKRGYDWVSPYYRDLTLMLVMGMEPKDFILSLMGKRDEPTSGGRQMPSHWNFRDANVISHSAPVATQTPHASGIGLGIKLRGEDKVVITTVGEGSTSQGEWYEGVNWAAIHKLPVVFIVQNNVYAISVRQDSQMAVDNVADKAKGLGLPGYYVDGTDFVAVYEIVKNAVDRAREKKGPTLIETKMYRITPHSSDDDDRTYRPRKEVEEHKKLDPLIKAEEYLRKLNIIDDELIEQYNSNAKKMVDEAVAHGENAEYPKGEDAISPVYAVGEEK